MEHEYYKKMNCTFKLHYCTSICQHTLNGFILYTNELSPNLLIINKIKIYTSFAIHLINDCRKY
ncbi:protein of unknown function [Legionella longbeachae NSW150]|uniref:Uncharacterized protein n=1 Tax=Legionella longbeachae serogroup 1 (strain NSW150) TaxID=661367 RepID=D3HS09_LEGLN|nr:protein of unknown function [Legionella longbeachae NSW150]